MFLCGVHPDHYYEDKLPVYFSHTPAGTSMHNLIHMSQLVETGKMQKWNYRSGKHSSNYCITTTQQIKRDLSKLLKCHHCIICHKRGWRCFEIFNEASLTFFTGLIQRFIWWKRPIPSVTVAKFCGMQIQQTSCVLAVVWFSASAVNLVWTTVFCYEHYQIRKTWPHMASRSLLNMTWATFGFLLPCSLVVKINSPTQWIARCLPRN